MFFWVAAGTSAFFVHRQTESQFQKIFGRPWVQAEKASADERLAIVTRLCVLRDDYFVINSEFLKRLESLKVLPTDSPEAVIEKANGEKTLRGPTDEWRKVRQNFLTACGFAETAGFRAEAKACGCDDVRR